MIIIMITMTTTTVIMIKIILNTLSQAQEEVGEVQDEVA